MARETVKHYTATVFRQAPAVNEQAVFIVEGHVSGSHEECWTQAKALVKFPVLQFQEVQHVPATV